MRGSSPDDVPHDRPGQWRCNGGALIAAGGQSYGGRVATLAAAPDGTGLRRDRLLQLPAPPAGPSRTGRARSSHWPAIRCPVLLLSGEADPLARIDLLRDAFPLLRHGEFHTYPKLGHTLKPVLDDALDRAAAFLLGLAG